MNTTRRIFFQIHKHEHLYFIGRSLEAATSGFIEKIHAKIVEPAKTSEPVQQYQKGLDSPGWTVQLNLHVFVSTHIFYAAIEGTLR